MLFDDSQVMHEVVNLCLSEGNRGVPTLKACKHVAELVQQEVTAAGQNEQLVACKPLDVVDTRLKSVAGECPHDALGKHLTKPCPFMR